MALDPLEWVTIGAIGIVIFIWGPDRIPQIVQSVRGARKAIDSATKELQAMSSELKTPVNIADESHKSTTLQDLPSPSSDARTSDRNLIGHARRLGVSTEGKTREQITKEIVAVSDGGR